MLLGPLINSYVPAPKPSSPRALIKPTPAASTVSTLVPVNTILSEVPKVPKSNPNPPVVDALLSVMLLLVGTFHVAAMPSAYKSKLPFPVTPTDNPEMLDNDPDPAESTPFSTKTVPVKTLIPVSPNRPVPCLIKLLSAEPLIAPA